jgi:hypothetical protein
MNFIQKNIRSLSFYTITSLFLIAISSCHSHEQKPDDAFENIKEQKKLNKDSVPPVPEIISDQKKTEIISSQKKTEVVPKSENQDWVSFRMGMEEKIIMNTLKIKSLKAAPESNTKQLRKVARLEKNNTDLRKQMDDYAADAKARQEKFRTSMNQDVNDIGTELKDMIAKEKR